MALNGTGSLVNGLASGPSSNERPPAPAVGDGATIYHWTDRSVATVTRVETSRRGVTTVYMVADNVKWLPHPSGYAESYSPGTGREFTARARKYKGKWRWATAGSAVRFGHRDAYYDPHF